LPDKLLDQALVATNAIQDESVRGSAFARLAPFLKGEQAKKAVTFADRMYNYSERNLALGSLGPYLTEESRTEVIDIIKKTTNTFDRLKGWLGLAPFLTSDLKQEAITTALTLTNEQERSEALVALAPHLPDVWKMKALESARKISNPLTKIHALSGLISTLPKTVRADALNETLDLARALPVDYDKGLALVDLIPLVPADLKEDLEHETFAVATQISDAKLRVEILIELAAMQPPGRRTTTIEHALSVATDIDDELIRGEALITLARAGFPDVQNRILKAAKDIQNPRIRSNVRVQLLSIFEQEPPPEPVVPGPQPEQQGPPTPDVPLPKEEDKEDRAAKGGAKEGRVKPEPPSAAEGPKPQPEQVPVPKVPLPEEEDKPVEGGTKKDRGEPKPPPVAPKPPPTPSPTPVVELHEPPDDDSVNAKTYLHSDRWTLDDQLNYSIYADAIAEFILHPDTKPPLAIGILAPWGQGKTTLMKLIQNELQSKAKQEVVATTGVVTPPLGTSVTFAYLRKWLRDPTFTKVKPLMYPTVWFNAWKYQNSEQLWAGMAYSILSQLVAQIGDQAEQEKFWLALQAERVDFNAIRQDIYRMIFERVAPWIGMAMMLAVIGFVLIIVGVLAGNVLWGSGGGLVMLAGVIFPVVKWLAERSKIDSKPLEGKFAQYVRQPTYEGKLGFFHEVETDVQRVFKLLVEKGKPAIVFIDDLDRCNPGTVSQVIEAMNLFLSADFPDCYFIVGMDAQVVAASMEVAYTNLDQKMKSVTRSYGSLGWYFMDKFIQLQFSIPNLTPDQRGSYLTKLLGQEFEKKELLPPAELDSLEKKIENTLNNPTLKSEQISEQAAEVAKFRQQRPQVHRRLANAIVRVSAQKLSDDNPTLKKHIERYEPYLGASPRGIKRFTNLYRFYNLSQITRRMQGLPACSQSALARWLVIMLRWPQVVRWIQWEGEAKFSDGTSVLKKAEAFEDQLLNTADHAAWLEHLEHLDPGHADWMADRQLYDFLKSTDRPNERLSLAVQTGVW
jgi:KAP family P-loop domain